MYMNDIKLFANNEKGLETLIQPVTIYSQDIGSRRRKMCYTNNKKEKQFKLAVTAWFVYLGVYVSPQIWPSYFKAVPFSLMLKCPDVKTSSNNGQCLKAFYLFIFVCFYYRQNIVQCIFRSLSWTWTLHFC